MGSIILFGGVNPRLLIGIPPLEPAEYWVIRPKDVEAIEMVRPPVFLASLLDK